MKKNKTLEKQACYHAPKIEVVAIAEQAFVMGSTDDNSQDQNQNFQMQPEETQTVRGHYDVGW